MGIKERARQQAERTASNPGVAQEAEKIYNAIEELTSEQRRQLTKLTLGLAARAVREALASSNDPMWAVIGSILAAGSYSVGLEAEARGDVDDRVDEKVGAIIDTIRAAFAPEPEMTETEQSQLKRMLSKVRARVNRTGEDVDDVIAELVKEFPDLDSKFQVKTVPVGTAQAAAAPAQPQQQGRVIENEEGLYTGMYL